MLLLAWLTNGSLNVYERYLFSAHMLHHMLLAMMVPLLLVPGAPVTLAARAIRKRTDGSRGGREWILLAVHSRFGRFVGHPIVAALLFAMSLLIFYYSPLFRWSTVDHIGHEWMMAHFLLTGYLFVQALVGVDPVPVRLPYPLRLLLLLGTMAFHAFFGLALLSGSAVCCSPTGTARWAGAPARSPTSRRAAASPGASESSRPWCWPSSWRCSGRAATSARRPARTDPSSAPGTPSSRVQRDAGASGEQAAALRPTGLHSIGTSGGVDDEHCGRHRR